jgi:vacuolar-type H+-ATPase subunit H
METKKNEGMKRKVRAYSGYLFKPAQRKEQQIIEQARKQANDEATKILNMVEEKGRQIISEAVKSAEVKAAMILAQAQQEAREIVAKAREQARSGESRTIPQNGEQIGLTSREAKNVVIESQLGTTMTQELDKGFGIIVEATKKAETEANKILAQAKETGRKIIEEATRKREGEAKKIVEEATRKAEEEGNKIVTQALQTGLQIIVEAARIADTEAETIKRISQGEPKEHRFIEEAEAAAVNRLLTNAKYGDVKHEVLHITADKEDTVFTETLSRQELANSLLKARPIAEVEKSAAAAPPSQTLKPVLKPIKENAGSLVLHAVLNCFSLWSKPREASDYD